MKIVKSAAVVALLSLSFATVVNLAWAAGADGAAIYKEKCAMCHDDDAAALKGKTEAQITKVLKNSPEHSDFKDLTPEQVKAIVKYVASLKK